MEEVSNMIKKSTKKKDNWNFFGIMKVSERPDVSISLRRCGLFGHYLVAIFKIMENADKFPGLKDVTTDQRMVHACDGWSGDIIPHTYLDRCEFILNFNSTAERDAAIPLLKKFCLKNHIRVGTYEFITGSFIDMKTLTIEPCCSIPESDRYMCRRKTMSPESIMYMPFFKDIRKEREYEKKQLEEYLKQQAG